MAEACSTSFSSSTTKTSEEILPYLFEPLRVSDDSDDGWTDCSSEEEENVQEQPHIRARRNEVASEIWCQCQNCQKKILAIECICCKEMDETRKMIENEKIACITDHPGFYPVCLNVDVLWTSLVNLADREGAYLPLRNKVTNRTYRYAAYRQFTWWVHNKLGRHVRRVIPSCAVSRIRAQFEEEDGNYVVFQGNDEVASEIVTAMEWRRDIPIK